MKKAFASIALFSVVLILINSCHKDDTPATNSSPGNSMQTTVSGIVTDDNNTPLSGVTVTAYGHTTTTNVTGTFVLKNIYVNKDRAILQFSKPYYFNRAHAFIPVSGSVNYVRIVLVNSYSVNSFSSSAGGTVTLPDGSSVQFQSNSFMKINGNAYSGTIYTSLVHLSPENATFGFAIPGGDLAAKDAANKDVALYSYGMLGVLLYGSSGEQLQLSTGTTATLTLPIASSQLGTAPSSIPLWYFDETVSLWKEQGQATKSGNNYTGTVSHFSWWNCDLPGDRATIKGRVLDCNNNPFPNIVVTVNTYLTLMTDQNGNYQSWVPAALALTVQVLAINNNNLVFNSQLENVPPLTGGQTFTVPDLLIPSCVSSVAGTITGCNNNAGNGMVYISWTGGYNFVYCTTGSFSVSVPANTSLDIKLYSGNSNRPFSITSGAAGTVSNIGNTALCDDGTQPENSFYITGNGYNNALIIVDTSSTSAISNSGKMEMTVTGYNYANGTPIQLSFGLMDTVATTYQANLSSTNSITLFLDYDFYQSARPGVQASCTVTQVQSIGGRVKGIFSGTLFSDSSSAIPTISKGKFNISRIN